MLRLEKQIRLNVPVGQLWPLISDTERMNRAGGLAPVQYRTVPNPCGPADVFAKSQFGPLKMQWQEFPFEWVQEDHFHVLRRFSKGPLVQMRPGIKLSGTNGSTQVQIFLEAQPRNVLGAWIARYVMWPAVLAKFQKILRCMEGFLTKNAPDPFWRSTPKAPTDTTRMGILIQGLKQRGVAEDLIALLARYLKDATDLDVSAMRPYALADRWGKNRTDVLKMFLHATQAGLVDLTWEILCPNCRKSKSNCCNLNNLSCKAHCDYCQISFDVEFDRSVEVRFAVHPSVRKVQRNEFCAGGPANTPHILAQVLVGPGETRSVKLNVMGAPLKVRSPGMEGFSRIRVLDEAPSHERALRLTSQTITPNVADVKVGEAIFALSNDLSQERWIIIERDKWDEAVATAAQVTSLQEFRDMFSAEVLGPGQEIAVRSLTFMFTDLAGSTATYHSLGDAKAYSMVREHFTVLREAIARHEGAVVKTIGDAVMAVFSSPQQGFMAALDMQGGIRQWNESRNGHDPVVLKIGLHQGPAIAVNTEDVLDYFGTSVNLAARVESLSQGGDIVLSDDVMSQLQMPREYLKILDCKEQLESPVKGFPRPIRAWRIWPN